MKRFRRLHRKAEHLVLSGPFRRQVGEASDAHAMREPAIDGGCSELATDNREVACCCAAAVPSGSGANGTHEVLPGQHSTTLSRLAEVVG